MPDRRPGFAAGVLAGVAATLGLGATQAPPPLVSQPLRPVAVTLHRFDRTSGNEARFREWIDFLHAHHREAVATLARERTYFEAMFTAPDEPRRLYWITVQGAGGQQVDDSTLELDRRHLAYMKAVLAKGSHTQLTTENVLAPDFIVRAVRDQQQRQERRGRALLRRPARHVAIGYGGTPTRISIRPTPCFPQLATWANGGGRHRPIGLVRTSTPRPTAACSGSTGN